MILNISLTVIDLNIDSSIILDFFILDLLSFRNFSFVGSPELVDVIEQKSSFWWHLGEFLLLFLLVFLLLILFFLLLFLLNFTLLILLLFVFLLLDVTWHLSIFLILLSLDFLPCFLKLFLHWVW